MICPICHKKVNRINSCRIIAASGTAKSKSKRTCQSCAKALLKLICDRLPYKSFIAIPDALEIKTQATPIKIGIIHY